MDYIVLTDWIINFDNSKAFDDRKVFDNPILVLDGSMGVDNPKEFDDPNVLVDTKVISSVSMDFDNPLSTVIPASSMVLFQFKMSIPSIEMVTLAKCMVFGAAAEMFLFNFHFIIFTTWIYLNYF